MFYTTIRVLPIFGPTHYLGILLIVFLLAAIGRSIEHLSVFWYLVQLGSLTNHFAMASRPRLKNSVMTLPVPETLAGFRWCKQMHPILCVAWRRYATSFISRHLKSASFCWLFSGLFEVVDFSFVRLFLLIQRHSSAFFFACELKRIPYDAPSCIDIANRT